MLGDSGWKPRSSQYNTIAQARASLSEPSRPYTPAEHGRSLFRTPAVNASGLASSLQRPDTSNSYDLLRPTSSHRSSSSALGSRDFAAAALPRAPVPRPSLVSSSGAEVLTLESPAPPAPAPAKESRRAEPKENVVPSQGQHDWWAHTAALLEQMHPDAPVEALLKPCDCRLGYLVLPLGFGTSLDCVLLTRR